MNSIEQPLNEQVNIILTASTTGPPDNVSIVWHIQKNERLPNVSLKIRQICFLDWKFLSQALMLLRSRR
jgi:hypothetical protein